MGNALKSEADKLPGLHALRLLAAFMVFTLHTVSFTHGPWLPVREVVKTFFALGWSSSM
jgi:peptidoglycan/LPS O-acetylase OafA/YrhL